MSSKRILLVLMLLSVTVSHAARDFRAPPKSTVEWVSSESRVEGMALKIRRFESNSLTVNEVLEFYRREWGELAAEIPLPPWKMIGTKREKEYWNVQVQARAGGGAWGYLSVSDLPDLIDQGKPIGGNGQGNGGKGFPKMSGSTVINDFFNNDIGRKGRTLLMENTFSVSSNVSFYKNHYQSRGFKAQLDHGDNRKGSHVLMMNKGNQRVNLTFNRLNAKTSITANEVTHGF